MLLLAILFSTLLIFVHSSPTPPTRDSRDLHFMQTMQEIEQWSPTMREEERLEVEMMEEEEEVLCTGEQEMCWLEGRRRCVQIEQDPTSCGGCASTGKGVNCTSLPGVASSSCRAGRCEALSCQPSYHLSPSPLSSTSTSSSGVLICLPSIQPRLRLLEEDIAEDIQEEEAMRLLEEVRVSRRGGWR